MKKNIAPQKAVKNQKGNFIVQLAIVLGVTAIVTLGGMKGFEKYQEAKVSNELQEITNLRSKVVDYGQSLGTAFAASNVTLASLNALQFFSDNVVSGSGATLAVANQWGGTVTPSVGTINSAGDSIVFTYSGVSEAGCKGIGNKFDTVAAVISVGGTQVKVSGARTNVATLGAQCEAGADNNTIAYTLAR